MDIQILDWKFSVDVSATYAHTLKNSSDHCACGYCQNYYDCVDMLYPNLRCFLSQFGVVLEGPSELMPFEPTILLACYRVHGEIISWGQQSLLLDTLPVSVEVEQNGTFLLWIGEMVLPWVLDVPEDEVISPANTPEFIERMQQVWNMRHGEMHAIS